MQAIGKSIKQFFGRVQTQWQVTLSVPADLHSCIIKVSCNSLVCLFKNGIGLAFRGGKPDLSSEGCNVYSASHKGINTHLEQAIYLRLALTALTNYIYLTFVFSINQ